MRRRHAFAASFVITAALAPACKKSEPTEKQQASPPVRVDAAPAVKPAPDATVSAATWAPDPDHPGILVPTPRTMENNTGRIVLEASLVCFEHVDAQCDPGEKCNPPAPREVPCPPQLMPRLAPGTEPTTRDANACRLGDIVVACP